MITKIQNVALDHGMVVIRSLFGHTKKRFALSWGQVVDLGKFPKVVVEKCQEELEDLVKRNFIVARG